MMKMAQIVWWVPIVCLLGSLGAAPATAQQTDPVQQEEQLSEPAEQEREAEPIGVAEPPVQQPDRRAAPTSVGGGRP